MLAAHRNVAALVICVYAHHSPSTKNFIQTPLGYRPPKLSNAPERPRSHIVPPNGVFVTLINDDGWEPLKNWYLRRME
jgi:hypothetical protein